MRRVIRLNAALVVLVSLTLMLRGGPIGPRTAFAANTIAPFRCPGAQLSFPVQYGGFIGWIYREPSTDPSGPHSGLDLWAGDGAPVAAVGTGTVVEVNTSRDPDQSWNGIRYQGVGIFYPSVGLIGLTGYYGHMKSVTVRVNDPVPEGRVIG